MAAVNRIGELAKELGAQRVLIVSDPGIVRAGYPAQARSSIEAAGLTAQVFDEVHENPTTHGMSINAWPRPASLARICSSA